MPYNRHMQPRLAVHDLSKAYGNVRALDGVALALPAGEIVAIVGDNGAGKSTLLKCVSGSIAVDAGYVQVGNRRLASLTPGEAIGLGISTVYQDLSLSEGRDAAANIFLGMERTRWGVFLDTRRMRAEASETLRELGLDIPSPTEPVRNLSGGQRQAVAIARAVLQCTAHSPAEPGILLFDEPTAALGVRESARVVHVIARLRKRGFSILCISHDIPMVLGLADRIAVMRAGCLAWYGARSETSVNELVARISGTHGHDA